MATFKQNLPLPENGYTRFDDRDINIAYIGSWGNYDSFGYGSYNATAKASTTSGDTLKFNFIGSKITISAYISVDTSGFNINIDGIDLGNISTAVANSYVGVAFTKTDLEYKEHSVILKCLDKSVVTNSIQTRFILDCIDIDDIGSLKSYNRWAGKSKTHIKDMNIGDVIPCRYTAASGAVGTFSELGTCTAAEISIASSATPDGLFYFVMAGYDHLGRKKLIADRNIQHSISWDALNSAGIASGLPIKIYNPLVPILTSNLQNGYELSASSVISGYQPYKMFDGKFDSFLDSWGSSDASFNQHVRIKFPASIVADAYKIHAYSYTGELARNIKSWTFEGSQDGTNWTVLHTVTNAPSWSMHEERTYEFNNSVPFLYYRINISANQGDMYCTMIHEMQIYKKEFKDYVFNTRLLTGGTSATDKDNEWDRIISESNLSSTITPGDNNIWNWSGIASGTSSSVGAVGKIYRGNTSNSNLFNGYSSNEAYANLGFRPVLLVESLQTTKYLIQRELDIYDLKSAIPSILEDLPIIKTLSLGQMAKDVLTEADLDNYACDDLSLVLQAKKLFPEGSKYKILKFKSN